jgi:hypothetical protein
MDFWDRLLDADASRNPWRERSKENLMPKLKILSGPEPGRSFALEPGGLLNIGRSPPGEDGAKDITTLVIEDKRVSRLHCQVTNEGRDWVLRDLKSSNGTFVNGERVSERVLQPGDLVQVGDVVLELAGEPERAQKAPPEPELRGAEIPKRAVPETEIPETEIPKTEIPKTEIPKNGASEPREDAPSEEDLSGAGEDEGAERFARGAPPPASPRRALPLAGALVAVGAAVGVILYLSLGPRSPSSRQAADPSAQKGSPGASAQATGQSPPTARLPPTPEAKVAEKQAPSQLDQGTIEARLREREYRLALAVLEDVSKAQPDFDTTPLRNKIHEAAQSEVSAAASEADQLSLDGSFDNARGKLEALLGRAPDDLGSLVLSALERVEKLEESSLDYEKKQEKDLVNARMLLAALDFPGAESAAKALAGAPKDEKEKALLSLLRRRLLEEIRLAGGAWERLSAIIDQKAQQEEALQISLAPDPQNREETISRKTPSGSQQLARREKDQLILREAGSAAKAGDADRVIELFSLDDPLLQGLMGLDGMETSRREQLLEGLGILLLYRSGPRRAEPYLSAGSIPKSRRKAYLSLMEGAAEIWLLARFEETCTLFRDLSDKKPPALSRWEDFCARITELVRNWRRFPGYPDRRQMLFDLFVRGKGEVFKLGGVEKLFHARRIELKGERLRLSYDFTSDDQLKDFHSVPRGAAGLKREGNLLKLKGECQLLSGDPFQGYLSVKGKVPANGFDPASPNVNVALFTGKNDQLTFTDKRPTSFFGLVMGAKGEEPNDYLVLALGYKVVVADFGGRLMEELRVAGNPNATRLPAHVLLAGKRGQALHTDPRECLWAAPLQGALPQGGLSFEAQVEGDKVSWKMNGKALVSEKDQLLKAPPAGTERTGSLSLFTHASEVKFSSLEVEGKLKKGWADQHVRSDALQEFRALDPQVK